MKRAAMLALLLGLAATTVIIAHEGVHAIASLLSRCGWGLLLLVPLHALTLLPDALGWRALIIGESAISRLYWIATIRQAVNRLLPVASIGGELVGIRLLRRTGMGGRRAAASVVAEMVITLIAEYVFVMLGILCLLQTGGKLRLVQLLVVGMLAGLPLIVGLALLVRHGSLFERVQRYAMRTFAHIVGEKGRLSGKERQEGAGIDAAIRETFGANGRLLSAFGWQFLSMIVGCLETWAALRLLGTPATFVEALVLESLTSAARHILFMVPAGLGVQELSFMALGQLFGIGSDVAVAMSLAKRISEIVFGLPALLSWQWMEGRLYLAGLRKAG